jgi:hypothetical protein
VVASDAKEGRRGFQDLTGQTFGRLTVIAFAGMRRRLSYWLCRCQCGKTLDVYRGHLRDGHTRSCGCLVGAVTRARLLGTIGVNATHGKHNSAEYGIWDCIKGRCENPRNRGWSYYGGRGIRVCEEWSKSFEAFFAFVGERPSPKHSIDRIDTNGNYEPGNVRWATRNEQQRNRRDSRRITHEGLTLSVWDWAERTGIPALVIWDRFRRGWSPARSLTVPVAVRKR